MPFLLWLLLLVVLDTVKTATTTAREDPEISPTVWDWSVHAIYLCKLIYQTPESQTKFGDLYFSDGFDDAVLIDDTYDSNVCFVAFRGSTRETLKNYIRDWKQNLRIKRERFCNKEDPTVCCDKTHKGFKQGYDTNYRDAFETKLEQVCNGRDWIFTGHSQGAAIAQVAALRYAHKDPLLLLFATAPAPFGQGNTCLSNLLSRTTLNYFNTKEKGVVFKKLRYDPITFFYHLKLGGYSEGHNILIPPNPDGHVAYFVGEMPGTAKLPPPPPYDVHLSGPYWEAIQALNRTSGGLPPQLDGFQDGQLCRHDEECQSKNCNGPFFLLLRNKFRKCR